MTEKVEHFLIVFLLFCVAILVFTVIYLSIYFANEIGKVYQMMYQVTADVNNKLKVSEEVTRAIVNGINGGW